MADKFYNNWIKITSICEEKIKESVSKCEGDYNKLPDVLKGILKTFYSIEIDECFGMYLNHMPISSGGNSYYKRDYYYNVPYGYYPYNDKTMLDELLHFVHYYLLDDGEVSILNGKLSSPDYENDKVWGNNITQTGATLWLLEELGFEFKCECLSYTHNNEEQLFEVNCFSEALNKFKKYISDNNIDKEQTRLDMYTIVGEKSVYIEPLFK